MNILIYEKKIHIYFKIFSVIFLTYGKLNFFITICSLTKKYFLNLN